MWLVVEPLEVFDIHDGALPKLQFEHVIKSYNSIFVEQVEAHDFASHSFQLFAITAFLDLSFCFLCIDGGV